jgi:hypothetical protein
LACAAIEPAVTADGRGRFRPTRGKRTMNVAALPSAPAQPLWAFRETTPV